MKIERYSGGINLVCTGKWAEPTGTRVAVVMGIPTAIIAFVILTHAAYRGIACPIHECLGIYCFLCGVTRSTWAILDGNFELAFTFNPMFFILLPYALLKYYELSAYFIKEKKIRLSVDLGFLVIAALVYMFWRNQWASLQPLPVDVFFTK